MAEALVQSGAFAFFATHFIDLGRCSVRHSQAQANWQIAKVLADRPGVLNRHLATATTFTNDNVPKMTMLYKIESGSVGDERYGVKLAGAVGFPPRFLEVAERMSTTLCEQVRAKKRSSGSRKVVLKRKLIVNLQEALQLAYSSEMDDGALAACLRKLQTEFIQRMEENEASEDETEEIGAMKSAGFEVIEVESNVDSD